MNHDLTEFRRAGRRLEEIGAEINDLCWHLDRNDLLGAVDWARDAERLAGEVVRGLLATIAERDSEKSWPRPPKVQGR
jgi:hypothetical protein